MKGTYPNSVFHFTDSFDNLVGILSDTFKMSYSHEEIHGIETVKEFYTPMVSFCDLRLSEIEFVSKKYGPYGIGLKKGWALMNCLNLVWYLNPQSPVFDVFCIAIDNYFKLTKENLLEDLSCKIGLEFLSQILIFEWFGH
jgi:hypothetical protein